MLERGNDKESANGRKKNVLFFLTTFYFVVFKTHLRVFGSAFCQLVQKRKNSAFDIFHIFLWKKKEKKTCVFDLLLCSLLCDDVLSSLLLFFLSLKAGITSVRK